MSSKQFYPFKDFFNVTEHREVIVKKITAHYSYVKECRFEIGQCKTKTADSGLQTADQG